MSVEIFLDQSNYLGNKLSKQAGAKIIVHDPKMPPVPDESGFELRPNTENSIAIQKTSFSRLPSPYTSNCVESWNETGYPIEIISNYSQSVSSTTKLQLNQSPTGLHYWQKISMDESFPFSDFQLKPFVDPKPVELWESAIHQKFCLSLLVWLQK